MTELDRDRPESWTVTELDRDRAGLETEQDPNLLEAGCSSIQRHRASNSKGKDTEES